MKIIEKYFVAIGRRSEEYHEVDETDLPIIEAIYALYAFFRQIDISFDDLIPEEDRTPDSFWGRIIDKWNSKHHIDELNVSFQRVDSKTTIQKVYLRLTT